MLFAVGKDIERKQTQMPDPFSQFYAGIKSYKLKTDYMYRSKDRTQIIITLQPKRFGDLNKEVDIKKHRLEFA